MKLSKESIVKKHVFFALHDVLVPGKANPSLSAKKCIPVLEFLKKLETKNWISLYLFTGSDEEKAMPILKANHIEKYFKKENIFFVDLDYIDSKEEVDKQRHFANLEQDPDFVDKFHKEKVLLDLILQGKITREESVLVCHDTWFDVFYSTRYSKVDSVLVKDSLSERNVPIKAPVRGLNYISLGEADLKLVLLGKLPKPDYSFLEKIVFEKLKAELLAGQDFSGLIAAKKKQAEQKDPFEGDSTIITKE